MADVVPETRAPLWNTAANDALGKPTSVRRPRRITRYGAKPMEESRRPGRAVTPAQIEQFAPIRIVVEDATTIPIGWRRDRLQISRATNRRVDERPILRLAASVARKYATPAVPWEKFGMFRGKLGDTIQSDASPVRYSRSISRRTGDALRACGRVILQRRRSPQQIETDTGTSADDVRRVVPLDSVAGIPCAPPRWRLTLSGRRR